MEFKIFFKNKIPWNTRDFKANLRFWWERNEYIQDSHWIIIAGGGDSLKKSNLKLLGVYINRAWVFLRHYFTQF